MKFIRKNGRIIPIKEKGEKGGKAPAKRKDGGVDLRKSGARRNQTIEDIRAASKEAQKHSRPVPAGHRAKRSVAMGIFGASAGTLIGMGGAAVGMTALGVAAKVLKKPGLMKHTESILLASGGVGATLVGGLGAYAGASSKGEFHNRQYNKAIGKRLANKRNKARTSV